MTLLDLSVGQIAFIEAVAPTLDYSFQLRLTAMGIITNKPIQVLRKGGLGGPIHLRVSSTTELAMRRREAAQIRVRVA